MPLHDWTDDRGWDSVHQFWVNSLIYWLQDYLPSGYRVYLGSVPRLAVAGDRPEVVAAGVFADGIEPDFQAVAVMDPGPQSAVQVTRDGQLVAAVEFVSPRNKDRPSSREFYRNRYLGYLLLGVNLALIDVHCRPLGFSFVDAVAAETQCPVAAGVPPHAASWQVGGPAPDVGRFLSGWHRRLAPGEPLPTLPLALAADRVVLLDLESTYAEAARRAYLT